jgi:hypothetical protein
VTPPQNSVATWCISPSGQWQRLSSRSISAQGRIAGGMETFVPPWSKVAAGFADMTLGSDLTRPGRVCTGFTSKCLSTPPGNKSSWRSRIAFPQRERFNHLEICAADAFGQRAMSRKVSSVVQGIYGNIAHSSHRKLGGYLPRQRHTLTRYPRRLQGAAAI